MPNGLVIYYGSNRDGTADIFRSSRASREDPWGTPVLLSRAANSVNQIGSEDFGPCLPSGESFMFFISTRAGERNIYRSTKSGMTWGTPELIGVSTTAEEASCWIRDDGQGLFFSSSRTGGTGTTNIFFNEAIGSGTFNDNKTEEVVELNAAGAATEDPWLSADQNTIFFASDRSGTFELYMSTR